MLSARAVSRGVAVGRAICFFGRRRQYFRQSIPEDRIEKEVRRFRAAIRLAKRQLKKIPTEGDSAKIFASHEMILDDRSFADRIESAIRSETVNAEWAVKTVSDGYVAQYKAIADDHIREKYIDIEDIAERILSALGGGDEAAIVPGADAVIVAAELRPSTLIELTANRPKAIVTEHGGWTSHTFILARELGLPAVTNVKGLLRRIRTGDELIVDGFNGTITINPTDADLERALREGDRLESSLDAPRQGPFKTLDGREIIIRANVDIPDVYARAKNFGARGIGLYRSEFLFNQYKGFPSEAEQIEAYRRIARQADGDPVRIRTFDLGVEQLAGDSPEREKNPALGLRAIRLMLTNRDKFRTQLRALLQASHGCSIDIVIPMISDIGEIHKTRELLAAEKSDLEASGIAVGNPKIGAMIETPASVLIADEIAAEVEFFCLGTNDLVQYLLAVDRDNAAAADWFRTLHPAVIRSVRAVLGAASKHGIPAVVCGEMAGSPVYVALLIGLGARELSMNVNSMPRVTRTIEGIAYEEAKAIVAEVDQCRTADEVERLVAAKFTETWSHLFPSEFLPLKPQ